MPTGLRDRLDDLAGRRVEDAVQWHHRRRLDRIDRRAQLDPPRDGSLWAAADPPPREGCELEVLIDGEEALPRVLAALEGARSHVHLANWCLTPGFGLVREPDVRRLRDVLGDLAERVDVRVLLWAGAPVGVMKPTRKDVRATAEALTRGTRVRVGLDANERPMHCHHEKLVVVDDEVAFVNGIDLTTSDGDRYDSREHPRRDRMGWHDVGTHLRGPVVGDVAAHWAQRWETTTSERVEVTHAVAQPRAGGHEVQLVRTVPERRYPWAPRGDFRILEAYTRALRSAERLIYLEDQFLWSPEVTDVLRQKLADPPHPDFRCVVLLPAKPQNGGDDTRGQLAQLVDADDGAHRFLAATIDARTGPETGPLYVHAKVGIVDDRWLTVGSANLNEHSLFNDTEVNVVACDPALARATRLRLWAEHLERGVDDVAGPPHRVVDELWRPLAVEQRERREAGAPATHRLRELPGVSRRSRALLGPLTSFGVDG